MRGLVSSMWFFYLQVAFSGMQRGYFLGFSILLQ